MILMEETYRSQFRMPQALYEKLKASADASHRSVNAELVARLESTFPEWSHIKDRETLEQFKETAGDMPLKAIMSASEINALAERMLDLANGDYIPGQGLISGSRTQSPEPTTRTKKK